MLNNLTSDQQILLVLHNDVLIIFNNRNFNNDEATVSRC